MVKIFLTIFTSQVWLPESLLGWELLMAGFCTQYPLSIKSARGAGSSFKPLTLFLRVFMPVLPGSYQMMRTDGFHSTAKINSSFSNDHWIICSLKHQGLALSCRTIRNNNPVGMCAAMTPRVGKLELIKYRLFPVTSPCPMGVRQGVSITTVKMKWKVRHFA